MDKRSSPPIGFIGTGRLGSALAAGLLQSGYDVKAVAGKTAESAGALAAALGGGVRVASEPEEVLALCDLVFLTVPDAVIAPVSESLPWRSQQMAVHCSGALSLPTVAAVARVGGRPGCLHPLQSFPSRAPEPDRFHGIFCGVEGEAPLGPLLETIVSDLGAQSFRLEGVDRSLYHASAVMAGNHVIALASAAGRIWTMAGLPAETARTALAPLLVAAAENVARLDLLSALTGPIARGDVQTVAAHLHGLAAEPSLEDLYRRLSNELLRLALNHPPEVIARLRDLLDTEG